MIGSCKSYLFFAEANKGGGVIRILYTAEGNNDSVVKTWGKQLSGCKRATGSHLTSNLGPFALGVQPSITSKCQVKGGLLRRLIELDQELYEQYAEIGAKGESFRSGLRLTF